MLSNLFNKVNVDFQIGDQIELVTEFARNFYIGEIIEVDKEKIILNIVVDIFKDLQLEKNKEILCYLNKPGYIVIFKTKANLVKSATSNSVILKKPKQVIFKDRQSGIVQKREFARLKINVAISFKLIDEEKFYRGYSQDIAINGIKFITDKDILKVNDIISIKFNLSNEEIYVNAEVLRINDSKDNKKEIAAKFLNLNENLEDKIALFILRYL